MKINKNMSEWDIADSILEETYHGWDHIQNRGILRGTIVQAINAIKKNQKDQQPTWQDQPTTDGFYWFIDDSNDLKIVDVYWTDFKILEARVAFHGTDDHQDVTRTIGKWYGPIKPPKEG